MQPRTSFASITRPGEVTTKLPAGVSLVPFGTPLLCSSGTRLEPEGCDLLAARDELVVSAGSKRSVLVVDPVVEMARTGPSVAAVTGDRLVGVVFVDSPLCDGPEPPPELNALRATKIKTRARPADSASRRRTAGSELALVS